MYTTQKSVDIEPRGTSTTPTGTTCAQFRTKSKQKLYCPILTKGE